MAIPIGEFADRLNEIMPVMMKEFARCQENELFKGKITFPQFVILMHLHVEGPAKMTDLANFMHVTTAAMTGVVGRLVRAGYAQRITSPGDRRIIKVKIAPKGEKAIRKCKDDRRRIIIEVFGRISASERKQYLNILTHILETITESK